MTSSHRSNCTETATVPMIIEIEGETMEYKSLNFIVWNVGTIRSTSETATTDASGWRLFDNVLRNSRSEEFSCGCSSSVHSHWRSRRESSAQSGVISVRFLRPRYKKRGGHSTSRVLSVWCESRTSDLAYAVQTEQKDRADLVAQLGATSEAPRTKIDGLARSGDQMPI